MITIHRRGDAIDTVVWRGQLKGLRVTMYRKILDTGLLEGGYTLEHPDLGQLEVNAFDMPSDRAGFLNALRPFTCLGH